MNRQLLLLWLLVMGAMTAYGQSYEDILQNRKVTVNYPDHTVTAYLKPVQAIATDSQLSYTWFSGHYIRITQGGYSGRLLHGYYQDFYLSKNLKEAGGYKNGLKEGVWKSWNEEGLLKEEVKWKHGLKHGKQLLYPGIKNAAGADSVQVMKYRKGKVVQPKRFFPKIKIGTPAFIKRIFHKKAAK